MPTVPPTITAPPTAPQRNDRTTFSARLDAFITWLVAAVAQFAALATNVYNNAGEAVNAATSAGTAADVASTQAGLAMNQVTLATDQANAAAASALTAINSPGTNATSTTSLTIGPGTKTLTVQTGKALSIGQFVLCANTASPGNYMVGQISAYNTGTGVLTFTVISVGGSGTFAAWTISLTVAVAGHGAGGADTTVSAVDITLLSSSGRLQAITMIADGKNVILPDATTLPKGGELFVLRNAGSNSFYARKPSGSAVVKVPPGASALLYLSDNTSADGVWAAGLLTQSTALAIGTILTVNATASSTAKSITALSPTTALVTWKEGAVLKATVLSINGLAVNQPGNILTIAASGVYYNKVAALNSTQALVYFSDVNFNSRAAVLTVTGNTVDIGPIATVHATKGGLLSLAVLSPTVAVVTQMGTGDLFKGFVLRISETTVIPGPEQDLGALPNTSNLVTLDSTHCACVYALSGVYAKVFSISGNTISMGGARLLAASTYYNVFDVVALSAGTMVAAICMGPSNFPYVVTGTIDAMLVTAGPIQQLDAALAVANGGALTALSASQMVASWSASTTSKKSCVVTLSDGALTPTTPLVTAAIQVYAPALTTLSNTRAVEVYGGTSSYLQAVIHEVL